MAEQRQEMRAIADNPAPPTFENTLVAMEKTGQLFNRAMAAFNGVTGANLNPELQKVQDFEAPKLAAHHDAIFLDSKLFQRVAAVYQQRDSLKLDPESLRLVEFYYKKFVHSGANLSDSDKAELKKLNEEESTLTNAFTTKLLAATKDAAYVTKDKDALAGLSDAQIAAAALAAKDRKLEGYVLPLQNTTQQPDLVALSHRSTRQALFENSWNRAERGGPNDTRDTVARLAQLRSQKAKLLGFPNYAAWKLEDQMAKTPDAALKFMDALVPGATARATGEAKDIQALIDSQKGGFKLEPWDWNFYAEQVRKAKYDMDEAQIKPYFELNNVLENGVFYAASQLYGITFKERKDIPVYNPDVRVFEVFDSNGQPLALCYCDYFKRDNKNGGAWMGNFVGQSKLLGTLPVVYNVANFSKPAPGEPALLSFRDVTTMFHEFGHALHGMFADTEYPSLSGYRGGARLRRVSIAVQRALGQLSGGFQPTTRNTTRPARPCRRNLPPRSRRLKPSTRATPSPRCWRRQNSICSGTRFRPARRCRNLMRLKPPRWRRPTSLSAVPPRYRSTYFAHIWGGDYGAVPRTPAGAVPACSSRSGRTTPPAPPSGFPETSRNRIPSSPACTVTSSPRSKSTSERLSASAGGVVSAHPTASVGTASGPEALQNFPLPAKT